MKAMRAMVNGAAALVMFYLSFLIGMPDFADLNADASLRWLLAFIAMVLFGLNGVVILVSEEPRGGR